MPGKRFKLSVGVAPSGSNYGSDCDFGSACVEGQAVGVLTLLFVNFLVRMVHMTWHPVVISVVLAFHFA